MTIDRRRFLAGVATLPFAAACGDTAETNLPPSASLPELRIGAQSWGSSQVTAKVAELLIREQLGVSARTIVRPEADLFTSVSTGDLHTCLEVWPLRNNAVAKSFLDTGKVEHLGTTGVGRSGFFVPSYLLEVAPEIATPSVAGALAGVMDKAGVTQLLVGPQDWLTPSPPRMALLGVGTLPIQRQGSEKALIDQVREAYEASRPFMVSLWYPHPLHAMYSLRAVGLPATDGCPVDSDPYGCDFPAERLVKVAWPGLRFADARLHAFLKAFAPPPDDIVNLLAGSQDAPEVLARNWIRTRPVVWGPWVAAARAAKPS